MPSIARRPQQGVQGLQQQVITSKLGIKDANTRILKAYSSHPFVALSSVQNNYYCYCNIFVAICIVLVNYP